ncbi:hypothetical protein Tco_0667542 [Tanacetum coccineum]
MRSLNFNGETEDRDPPRKFTRAQILTQLDRLPTREKGKHPSYGGVKIKCNVLVELNWTKRSIFYELEYWSFLTLKHNLDVMHIEKNVLESFLNTLLMNDKSKDTTKARQDLKNLGIQSELWLGQNKNGKCSKPQAKYSFTPENRKKFCQFIKGVKLPDGFGSNFKHKVTDNDSNITDLKSHDCHIMMQCLLPYKLQQYLPTAVATPIIELCSFFKQIYSRTLMEADMICQHYIDKDPGVGASGDLFALAYGPTLTPILVNSCIVNGVRFVVHSRDERRTTQNNGICSPSEKDGYIMDSLKKFSNIIDVDEYDDFIDDEDVLPHDLAGSDDEDLINDDDDDVAVMSTYVARVHGGAGGGDDRPPSTLEFHRLPRNLRLRKITDQWDPQKIQFEGVPDIDYWPDAKNAARALQNAQNRAKSKVFCRQGSRSLAVIRDMQFEARIQYEKMLRLRDLGENTPTCVPYTEDQIIAMVRQGKQRGYIPGVDRVLAGQGRGVISINEPRCTHINADVDEVKEENTKLRKELNMLMTVVRSDDRMSQLLTQLQSQHEVGSGNGSGGGRG